MIVVCVVQNGAGSISVSVPYHLTITTLYELSAPKIGEYEQISISEKKVPKCYTYIYIFLLELQDGILCNRCNENVEAKHRVGLGAGYGSYILSP